MFVTEIVSCQLYATSRQVIEQLENYFASIFLWFLEKKPAVCN